MTKYRATCWMGSEIGTHELEVDANTSVGAEAQLRRIYGAKQISNLYPVHERTNYSGISNSDSGASLGGVLGLAGLVAAAWVFLSFAPWILMGIGGMFGTWISQKLTGQTLSDYMDTPEPDTFDHLKASFVLTLTLTLGGLGFYQGDQINKSFIESPKVEQQAK